MWSVWLRAAATTKEGEGDELWYVGSVGSRVREFTDEYARLARQGCFGEGRGDAHGSASCARHETLPRAVPNGVGLGEKRACEAHRHRGSVHARHGGEFLRAEAPLRPHDRLSEKLRPACVGRQRRPGG